MPYSSNDHTYVCIYLISFQQPFRECRRITGPIQTDVTAWYFPATITKAAWCILCMRSSNRRRCSERYHPLMAAHRHYQYQLCFYLNRKFTISSIDKCISPYSKCTTNPGKTSIVQPGIEMMIRAEQITQTCDITTSVYPQCKC